MTSTLDAARPTRWIIDLDFDADPETTGETVRLDLRDHLTASRGRVDVHDTRLIFEDAADALASRLRYGAHLVRVATA